VDLAKGMGIAIVFCGHFVQCFIDPGVPIASSQMRWIHAIHMPMFFMLVGFVYKERALLFDGFIKRQVRTRLVPVWVFNVAGMLIWIATEYRSYPKTPLPDREGLGEGRNPRGFAPHPAFSPEGRGVMG
jgi:fucose 4-O-acetylase-like acetyltransferase